MFAFVILGWLWGQMRLISREDKKDDQTSERKLPNLAWSVQSKGGIVISLKTDLDAKKAQQALLDDGLARMM